MDFNRSLLSDLRFWYCIYYSNGKYIIWYGILCWNNIQHFLYRLRDSGICCQLLFGKRFHARWWDYSTKPMNLHGRIWIGNLILFGIGGTLVIEVINPIMYSLFALIPERSLYALTSIIILTMSADYLTSHLS